MLTLTLALAYVVVGLVPLAPYFFLRSGHYALIGSVIVTLIALSVFGFVLYPLLGFGRAEFDPRQEPFQAAKSRPAKSRK